MRIKSHHLFFAVFEFRGRNVNNKLIIMIMYSLGLTAFSASIMGGLLTSFSLTGLILYMRLYGYLGYSELIISTPTKSKMQRLILN